MGSLSPCGRGLGRGVQVKALSRKGRGNAMRPVLFLAVARLRHSTGGSGLGGF